MFFLFFFYCCCATINMVNKDLQNIAKSESSPIHGKMSQKNERTAGIPNSEFLTTHRRS